MSSRVCVFELWLSVVRCSRCGICTECLGNTPKLNVQYCCRLDGVRSLSSSYGRVKRYLGERSQLHDASWETSLVLKCSSFVVVARVVQS
ncbi:hypothetical protein F4818DRAFT_404063 [Hypoxylon cercidicola]|nr:hypothetical protein F4818DRAFT_404063 [Hypoxylon cercidicola]